jgi:hypothetical protein
VGDVGGLANVGEGGVGGWTTLSVSVVVAVVVAVAGESKGGPCERWRLEMRGLAVPPAGVLELDALGILILLPRSSAMPVGHPTDG